ncbi:hypothetical protein [uncultured Selenomonas sp.]|uniref:hypothetical protein n=1 Tax=uncultured Selenomonas sp. TaxID=159275 RepID=UPI0025D55BF4|nr:hypothetical protein [uncultured Selenomonas sp.]
MRSRTALAQGATSRLLMPFQCLENHSDDQAAEDTDSQIQQNEYKGHMKACPLCLFSAWMGPWHFQYSENRTKSQCKKEALPSYQLESASFWYVDGTKVLLTSLSYHKRRSKASIDAFIPLFPAPTNTP